MVATMKQVSTTNEQVIQFSDQDWRLISHEGDQPQEIFRAIQGKPILYSPGFGASRNLPIGGNITDEEITRVSLGWEVVDKTWHLGIILTGKLQKKRNSRWLEIASWEDLQQDKHEATAKEAGEALAKVLGVRYSPIESTKDTQYGANLAPLPLEIGIWYLEERPDDGTIQPNGLLQFKRATKWYRQKIFRTAWYAFWAVIYVIVSITTLNADIALPASGTLIPNPQWLPYLGIGAAFLLVGIVVRTIWQLLTEPDRIYLNPQNKTIGAYKGKNQKWEKHQDEIQSVYVTEVIKKKSDDTDIYHGEINLYVGNKEFAFVLDSEIQEDHAKLNDPSKGRPRNDTILELNALNANSDLQAAGLYIAKMLGEIPCWHDVRMK